MAIERGEMKRPPTHPGYVVGMELEDLGLSITEAAQRLRVSRQTLSQLVNEKRGVSPEMALRLGRFFGNGPDLWLNMQTRFDRWRVEHDAETRREVARIEPVVG